MIPSSPPGGRSSGRPALAGGAAAALSGAPARGPHAPRAARAPRRRLAAAAATHQEDRPE